MPDIAQMPDSDQLGRTMEVATREEVANYALQQYEKKIGKLPKKDRETYDNVLKAMHDWADTIRNRDRRAYSPWSGGTAPTDLENYHNNSAQDAIAKLNRDENLGAIKMDYALTSILAYLRGYNEGALSEAQAKNMDDIFNCFLVTQDPDYRVVSSKDGFLYQADDNGDIVMRDGQPQKADRERVLKMIEDPEKGFVAFIEKIGLTKPLEMNRAEVEVEVAPAPVAATSEVAAPQEVEAVQTVEEKPVEPEGPASSSSRGGR